MGKTDITIKLSADILAFTGAMDKVKNQLSAVGASMKKIGQDMAGAGRSMTVGLTVPIVAAGATVLKFGADFEKAMTESISIMGDLSEAMKKDMSDAAREVAVTTRFSAKEAAESFFFLASAGLDAKQSIAALPEVAQFAQAGNFNMALATDLLTDAQSALGLTIRDDVVKNMENMARVSDVLVKANTLANASVQQFSESLTNRAGAALKSTNKSVEEGVAVLSAFADQGVKGQLAGQGLFMILRDLQTAAIKNQEAFTDYNVSVFDSTGTLENIGSIISDLESALTGLSDEQKKAALQTLGFTDRSQGMLLTLLGTSDAIKEYQKALEDSGGTTREVSDKQIQNFWDQLGLLKDRLADIAIDLSETLIPVLNDVITSMGPVIDKIKASVEWFGKLDDSTKANIIKWTALVAAIGPVLIVFGVLITTIGTVVSGMGAIIGVLKLATPFIAGISAPVLIAVSAFAAWILVGKQLLDNWELIASGTKELYLQIKTWLLDKFNAIVEGIKESIDNVKSYFGGLFDFVVGESVIPDMVKEIGRWMGPQLKIALVDNAKWATNKTVGVFGDASDDIVKIEEDTTKSFSVFQDAKETAARGVANSIKLIWSDTSVSFRDVWTGSLNVFVDTMAQMVIRNKGAMTAIQIQSAAATAGVTLLIGALASVIGGGRNQGPSQLEQAQDNLKRSLDSFLDSIRTALRAFEDETLSVLERLELRAGDVTKAFGKIDEATKKFIENVTPVLDEPGGFSKAIRENFETEFKQIVVDNLDALITGIQERYDIEKALLDEVTNIIKTQQGFVKDLNQNITEVQRAFLSPQEMFDAVLGDISALEALVSGTTGQAQIDALSDLQSAYNSLFGLAKDLFADNPDDLARWQDFVIGGLEGIKDTGISAYDQLIDLGLLQAELTREGLMQMTGQTDLQAAINEHLGGLQTLTTQSLELLRTIAEAPAADLPGLITTLSELLAGLGLIQSAIPAFAHGGIVNSPTLARVGEVPEAIIPLSRIGNMGGSTFNFSFPGAFPNVTDIRDVTQSDWESVLKTSLLPALQNIGRDGHKLPIGVAAGV